MTSEEQPDLPADKPSETAAGMSEAPEEGPAASVPTESDIDRPPSEAAVNEQPDLPADKPSETAAGVSEAPDEVPAASVPTESDIDRPPPEAPLEREPSAAEEAPSSKAGKRIVAFVVAGAMLVAAVLGYNLLFAQGGGSNSSENAGSWSRMPFPPIDPRYGHAAVWTGSGMIVWGGFSGVASESGLPGAGILADGAELDLARKDWQIIPPAPQPHRPDMAPAWTGKEMVAWGGDPSQPAVTMAYEPVTRVWRTLSQSPVPLRGGQSAVWTGSEVLLWGGRVAPAADPGGAPSLWAGAVALNPATDSWRELPVAPISPRDSHSALWTGKQMIVWGGLGADDSDPLTDGAMLDPVAGTWKAVPAAPYRIEGNAVWDGKEMLVAGFRAPSRPGGGGAEASPAASRKNPGSMTAVAFSPALNKWRKLPPPPVSVRRRAVSVWTGRRLVVWGGFVRSTARSAAGPASDGAAYDPRSNRWRRIRPAPIKGRDTGFSLIAGGGKVFVWGGKASQSGTAGISLADGATLVLNR